MSLFKKKQLQPTRRAGRYSRDSVNVDEDSIRFQQTFRRNRTLTGSLVSHVQGAGERHGELRSPRVQAHDLRHHRRRLFYALLSVLCAAGILGFLIYESIAIPRVATPLGTLADQSIYSNKIQEYLNGHFLERSRLTLNTTHLVEYLQQNGCPEVAGIVDKPTFGGIGITNLTLSMRKPVVSWQTGSSTLYVDADGNAFQRNYFATPSVEVVDQTGIQAQQNQVLVSDRFLGFIGKAVGRLKEQGYIASRVVLPPNTTRQIQVSLEGVPYAVKLSVDRPAGEQSEDAARAIKYLAAHGTQPAEYLDVRVSGKAFYK